MGSHMRLLSWPASRLTRCNRADCRDAAVCPIAQVVTQLPRSANPETIGGLNDSNKSTRNRQELDKTGKSLQQQQDRLRRRRCATLFRMSGLLPLVCCEFFALNGPKGSLVRGQAAED